MTDITIEKINSEEDIAKCFQIRAVVFIEEQNVPYEEEIDGLDPVSDQFLLSVDGEPIATARVRYQDDLAKIERVAVLKGQRGLNIGYQLMQFIIADILTHPTIKHMKLAAQVQVTTFYEKLGFESYGDVFLDAAIDHIWMKREI